MVTDAAFAVLQFSTGVVSAALCLWLGGRRWPEVRTVALRVAVAFAILLAASGYVWLDLGPAVDARLKAPPRLTWTPVRNATYYNVQLYIGGRKVLTAWPSGPSFQVPRSWRFQGRTHRLVPGRYRWYVWPGLGPRSASRYGQLVGTRTFVLVRG